VVAVPNAIVSALAAAGANRLSDPIATTIAVTARPRARLLPHVFPFVAPSRDLPAMIHLAWRRSSIVFTIDLMRATYAGGVRSPSHGPVAEQSRAAAKARHDVVDPEPVAPTASDEHADDPEFAATRAEAVCRPRACQLGLEVRLPFVVPTAIN
jgi:hypothetical protein